MSDLEGRFWSKINQVENDECWEWRGATSSDGYGQFFLRGETLYAHRVMYQEYRSGNPDGQMVLHHCDNPTCVNPNHLYLGDQSDNMQDAVKRDRLVIPGPREGGTKLTEEDVSYIKWYLRNTGRVQKNIGEQFGVTQETISSISRGDAWNHVEPEEP